MRCSSETLHLRKMRGKIRLQSSQPKQKREQNTNQPKKKKKTKSKRENKKKHQVKTVNVIIIILSNQKTNITSSSKICNCYEKVSIIIPFHFLLVKCDASFLVILFSFLFGCDTLYSNVNIKLVVLSHVPTLHIVYITNRLNAIAQSEKEVLVFLFFKPNVIYVCDMYMLLSFYYRFRSTETVSFSLFQKHCLHFIRFAVDFTFFFSLLFFVLRFFRRVLVSLFCVYIFQSFFRCSHTQSAQLVFIFSGYVNVNVHDCMFGARNFIWFWCVSAFLWCWKENWFQWWLVTSKLSCWFHIIQEYIFISLVNSFVRIWKENLNVWQSKMKKTRRNKRHSFIRRNILMTKQHVCLFILIRSQSFTCITNKKTEAYTFSLSTYQLYDYSAELLCFCIHILYILYEEIETIICLNREKE